MTFLSCVWRKTSRRRYKLKRQQNSEINKSQRRNRRQIHGTSRDSVVYDQITNRQRKGNTGISTAVFLHHVLSSGGTPRTNQTESYSENMSDNLLVCYTKIWAVTILFFFWEPEVTLFGKEGDAELVVLQ